VIVGSNPGGSVDVPFECHLLSGRGLCEGPITRPDESYRVWCDRGTSQRRPRSIITVEPWEKKINANEVTKTYVQELAQAVLKLCSITINTAYNFM